jgi:hypothetical protein
MKNGGHVRPYEQVRVVAGGKEANLSVKHTSG